MRRSAGVAARVAGLHLEFVFQHRGGAVHKPVRVVTLLFILSPVLAGRYPAPTPMADYLGTARWVLVGTVGKKGVTVQHVLHGKKAPKLWPTRIRNKAKLWFSGATKLELKRGARVLVFVEADGAARDWGSVHRVDGKGKITPNGVWGLGADVAGARQAVARLMDPNVRARLRRELDGPTTCDRAIRTLTQLRDTLAAPKIVAIARGPSAFRRVAVGHLAKLDHPDVVPTLMRALRDPDVAGPAGWSLRSLTGKKRAAACVLLAKETSPLARAILRDLKKK